MSLTGKEDSRDRLRALFPAPNQSNEVLVRLDEFRGVTGVDLLACQATAKAGTTLRELGETLFEAGLAQENLGDIDRQTLAGAVSTGTRGTGVPFRIRVDAVVPGSH